MADMINLDQKLEVRDPSGKMVAFLVPERMLRDLLAEQDRMRQELLRSEQARQEIEKERDRYRMLHQALGELYRPHFEKEFEEQKETGIPFELLIQEMDKVAEANSGRNQNGN